MNILKIEQSKLNQIKTAIYSSADFTDNCEKHLDFADMFGGGGSCGNIDYDSYNQYNISGDKIIELGFESTDTLAKWLDEAEALINDDGINNTDLIYRWKTKDIIKEMRDFCK